MIFAPVGRCLSQGLSTQWLGAQSYPEVVPPTGLEPVTPALRRLVTLSQKAISIMKIAVINPDRNRVLQHLPKLT